jgi:hypothetical protein
MVYKSNIFKNDLILNQSVSKWLNSVILCHFDLVILPIVL